MKNMRRWIACLAVVLLCMQPAMADEGMWLPSLISQRIDDMRAKGFRLTAEDIYSINKASMKDAVVLFNGGCTGELISSEGLLGGNFVELVPGGALDNLAPGDEIEDTQGAVSLITLLMKFVGSKAGDPEPGAAP